MTKRYSSRCRCGAPMAIQGTTEQARRAIDSFGLRHAPCARAMGEAVSRCEACGCMLLPSSRCPVPGHSGRVEWTEELEAAYAESLESWRAGEERVPVPAGASPDVYARAVSLAKRWEGRGS